MGNGKMLSRNEKLRNGAAHRKRVTIAYGTVRGVAYRAKIEDFLDSKRGKKCRGKVQLIFTSPPFPLNRKKRYGNLQGEEYLKWLGELAPRLCDLLKPDGSLVIELGNSWQHGQPTMSTLAIESLLKFRSEAGLNLCQQFVCYNPARLPSPAQWVNVERIRVKDSFTLVWWMSASTRPQADNRRVLTEYSKSMKHLLESKKYNAGKRPSEHRIGMKSFLTNNNGAIPSNVLTFSNTSSSDAYLNYCRHHDYQLHPARMAAGLAEFFVKFLTVPRNLVLDPFAGSNVTGAIAERLKRRWIAVEPEEEYLRGSRGRFKTLDRDYLV